MSGFDNGTAQSGIFFQAKQFGSILRGFGPPVPQAGVVGDLYIDTQTWFLYNKRATDITDPWGHYLFQVPLAYRTTLKWFTSSFPTSDMGVAGDYCLLWGGFTNYGMQPSVFGPKQASGWPENGDSGVSVPIAAPGNNVIPVGLTNEGAPIAESGSTQLIATGLTSEVILPLPVQISVGSLVLQLGLQSGPAQVGVVTNPLYTTQDQHAV